MEKVIDKLMDAEEGLASESALISLASLTTVGAIVSSPVLLHPRVNKALIALVAKKLVVKSSAKVRPSCGRADGRARRCTLGSGSRRASDGDLASWLVDSTRLYHIALA
jgi:hypothetical protein